MCQSDASEVNESFLRSVRNGNLSLVREHLDYAGVNVDTSNAVSLRRYTTLVTSSQLKLDSCSVWNAHNTVFGLKGSAICAQAVYFLHSTMPRVTCLRLNKVDVICRVTYLQFPIQACFFSTSVSEESQRRTWFTQYRTSDVAENLGRFLVRSVQPEEIF